MARWPMAALLSSAALIARRRWDARGIQLAWSRSVAARLMAGGGLEATVYASQIGAKSSKRDRKGRGGRGGQRSRLRTGAGVNGVVMGCAARKAQKPALEIGGWAGGATGSLFLFASLRGQRRSLRRLWVAGSIGGSSHHPQLLGLSSPGVCWPRGAALRPCAPRGHVELTRFCCCCR